MFMLYNLVDEVDLIELLKVVIKLVEGLVLIYVGDGKFKLNELFKMQFGDVLEGFLIDGFMLFWYVCWFYNLFGKGLYVVIWYDYVLKLGRKKLYKEFFILLVECKVFKWKVYFMWFFVWVYL